MQVVEDGALAPAIGTGQRHERGVAGKAFQIEGQHIQSEAIADAAKAFQGQQEGVHRKGYRGIEPQHPTRKGLIKRASGELCLIWRDPSSTPRPARHSSAKVATTRRWRWRVRATRCPAKRQHAD